MREGAGLDRVMAEELWGEGGPRSKEQSLVVNWMFEEVRGSEEAVNTNPGSLA